MKILYYNCFSGISGDMNLGAMIDLGVDRDYLISQLNKLSISDEFELDIFKSEKMGISGTKVDVILKNENHEEESHTHHEESHTHHHEQNHECDHIHHHHHEHRNILDIYELIEESSLSENIKSISKKIFTVVGESESKVHRKTLEEVHFHEVGAVDSIVDIVGAAICFDYLKVDKIIASTVELGSGYVKCAHGLMPVPAPATADIVKSMPVHIGRVDSEATTPTGAAILKTVADEYTDDINFKIIRTGYGIGTKDFKIPNILRVMLGELDKTSVQFGFKKENTVIEVNIDDMNPELLGYIEEKLLDAGALDFYKTPIIMKKGRLATKLSILVDDDCEYAVEKIILEETSTLGIRKYKVEKKYLERHFIDVETKYGKLPIKIGVFKGEILKYKGEYEICKKLANENNISINKIYDEINKIDIEKIWKDNN